MVVFGSRRCIIGFVLCTSLEGREAKILYILPTSLLCSWTIKVTPRHRLRTLEQKVSLTAVETEAFIGSIVILSMINPCRSEKHPAICRLERREARKSARDSARLKAAEKELEKAMARSKIRRAITYEHCYGSNDCPPSTPVGQQFLELEEDIGAEVILGKALSDITLCDTQCKYFSADSTIMLTRKLQLSNFVCMHLLEYFSFPFINTPHHCRGTADAVQ